MQLLEDENKENISIIDKLNKQKININNQNIDIEKYRKLENEIKNLNKIKSD